MTRILKFLPQLLSNFCTAFSHKDTFECFLFDFKGPFLQLPNPISFVITLFLLTIKNFWKIIAPFATQKLPWENGVEIARVVSSLLECKKMLGSNKKCSRNGDLFSHLDNFFETHLIKFEKIQHNLLGISKFCIHPRWNGNSKMKYVNCRTFS